MAQDVIMPQMGESLAEGTITKWLKKVGEPVEKDEPLFEISTDKVDAEIPSPAAGILAEIRVGEGETVEVNTVVAVIAAEGETTTAPPAGGSPSETGAPEPTAVPASAPPAAAPSPAPAGGDAGSPGRRLRSSPVVRRIAKEHGVDLSRIQGSGVGGRVTKKDILAYLEKREETPAAPAPGFAPPAAPAGDAVFIRDLRIPPYVEGEPVTIEPMSVMRKKIAEHMAYSKTLAAQVTSFFDVDFQNVAAQRAVLKADFAAKGVHLTYMPFIVRAVVDGLQRFPYLNASLAGDSIVFKKEINIGIAVSLADGKGLIVPVVRHADERNLLGLARAIQDLAERARTKKLSPDEVQRGTFSITNPGVYGGLGGTPIINQPQVAILGVGAVEKRPVVIDDAIAIRLRAYLSLTYDHRLVDGAMAEMFMAHVKKVLEAGTMQ